MIFRKERTFWMKKKTLIALILLACMLLTACVSTGGSTDSSSDTVVESSTPEPVEAKADAKDGEDFRNNLAAGLNARLALFNSEEYVNSHEFVDLMTSWTRWANMRTMSFLTSGSTFWHSGISTRSTPSLRRWNTPTPTASSTGSISS